VNVLVTGGAGFIGSHLVERLLTEGHAVKVIDDCSTGRESNLTTIIDHPSLRFLRGSILNEQLVAAALSDSDLVYHLAAAVGVAHILKDPLWAIVTNAHGTEIVLKRAHATGTRVLLASTSEIYGESEAVPFREDSPRVLGPTWVHRWAYSTSKALDEHLAFAYAERGLPVTIVRYFNVFGTRMDPQGYGSVIARFLTQALAGESLTVYGDGRQTRTFTHVSDAVEATIRAATLPQAVGEAFNVGGRLEVSINDLAERIRRVTASAAPITHVPYDEAYGPGFADTRRRVPDIAKAFRVLGWEPLVELDAGLGELVAERAVAAAS
jgi:UDP-glucose 4-epimerase